MRVILDARAASDLDDILRWYKSEEDGAELRFMDSFEEILKTVIQLPSGFPEVKPGIRKCEMRIFPYSILYQVDLKKALITILVVFHQLRSPKSLLRRLKS